MARDGSLSGDDVEDGCVERPPRFRHFAIGNKAFVKDVAVSDPVGPERLKVEGICGCQDAWTGHDFCGRGAADAVEFAFFGFEIVFAAVGVQYVAGEEMLQPHMAAGIGPIGIGVEVDLVGGNAHLAGLELCSPFEILPFLMGVLEHGAIPDFIFGRQIGLGRMVDVLG